MGELEIDIVKAIMRMALIFSHVKFPLTNIRKILIA